MFARLRVMALVLAAGFLASCQPNYQGTLIQPGAEIDGALTSRTMPLSPRINNGVRVVALGGAKDMTVPDMGRVFPGGAVST